jgi:DNA end-binding protein Ku
MEMATAAPERSAVSRAFWTGIINFGMVAIPVKLYAATEDRGISFNRVCGEHNSLTTTKVFCKDGNHECAVGDLLKGIQTPTGLTVLDPADLARLEPLSAKTVTIKQFVPLAQAASLAPEKRYFIGADSGKSRDGKGSSAAARALGLLRSALRKTGTAGIATVTLRGANERLAVITADQHGDVFLTVCLWPDEQRTGENVRVSTEAAPDDAMLDMAVTLVTAMRGDLDTSTLVDTYRDRVQDVIDNHGRHVGEPVAEAKPAVQGNPMDSLHDALFRSLKASK